METTDSVAVPGRDAGYLQLRVVPDDNSCLFSAIGIIFEGGMGAAQSLRKGEEKGAEERWLLKLKIGCQLTMPSRCRRYPE